MLAFILGIFAMGNSRKVGQGDKVSELTFVLAPVDRNEVGSKNEMHMPPSLSVNESVLFSVSSSRYCRYLRLAASQSQISALDHPVKFETAILVYRRERVEV